MGVLLHSYSFELCSCWIYDISNTSNTPLSLQSSSCYSLYWTHPKECSCTVLGISVGIPKMKAAFEINVKVMFTG